MKKILAITTALAILTVNFTSVLANDVLLDQTYNYDFEGLFDSLYEEFDKHLEDGEAFYEKYGTDRAIDVYYNFSYVNFGDVFPLTDQGTTFVPIRAFSELLGATVGYDNDTKRVTITHEENVISLNIGDSNFDINGENVDLGLETYALEERTYVPLRLISEAFGFNVYWVQPIMAFENSSVSIVDLTFMDDFSYDIIDKALDFVYDTFETEENFEVVGDVSFYMYDGYNSNGVTEENEIDITTNLLNYYGENGVNLSCETSMDLSEYKKLVIDSFEQAQLYYPEYYTDEYLEETISLLEMLENFSIDIMVDNSDYSLYIKSELITFLEEMLFGTNNIKPEYWAKIQLEDMIYENELDVRLSGKDYVYGLLEEEISNYNYWLYPSGNFFTGSQYDELLFTAIRYEDSNFELTSSGYVYSDEIYDTTINATLLTGANGDVTGIEFEYKYEEGYFINDITGETSTIVAGFDGANLYINYVTSSAEYYGDSSYESLVEASINLEFTKTDKVFNVTPPTGDVIIDITTYLFD